MASKTKNKKGESKEIIEIKPLPAFKNQNKFGPAKLGGPHSNQSFNRRPLNIVRHKV